MRKHLSSLILMGCGILALVLGMMTMSMPSAVSAQEPEPSPRPGLPGEGSDRKPTAVVPGRLTGTVIDLRTGIPATGITVAVGDQTISTDSNGNYDIWLVSGNYTLDLVLTAQQGTAIQPAQVVAVGAGDTVVVHLFFRSTEPTVTVQPVIQPTATLVPVVPTSVPVATPQIPQSLPNTSTSSDLGTPTTWLLIGVILIGMSLVVRFAPTQRRRTHTNDSDKG
ncbi:hypothetical protein [Candidatus Oscillochloris fontis]|uniref:hypothetical protein n=1 Tax=Candidatus Oscillochloris fontis TaxID=2496868 RepID=UPI00101D4D8F|nr:hypothetical protein [Candidatus Oscillochloris fontis]